MLHLGKSDKVATINLVWIDLETGLQREGNFEVDEEVSGFIDGLLDMIAKLEKKIPDYSLN